MILIGIIGVTFSACSHSLFQNSSITSNDLSRENSSEIEDLAWVKVPWTSDNVSVSNFKNAGISIGDVIIINEYNDPECILTRNTSCSEVIYFADNTINDSSEKYINWSIVEVYYNRKNALERYQAIVNDKIESSKNNRPFESCLINGKVVLILNRRLSKEQCSKYEQIFTHNK